MKVPPGVDVVDIVFYNLPAKCICRHGTLWLEGSYIPCVRCREESEKVSLTREIVGFGE